jgi:hypothetical protein
MAGADVSRNSANNLNLNPLLILRGAAVWTFLNLVSKVSLG